METIYSNKKDDYEFEKYICLEKPELWLNEANNLFYSAEILDEFENLKNQNIFDKKDGLISLFSENTAKRFFFNYRVQRMLWAYGFESIFKGLIIKDIKKSFNITNITPEIMKEIQSHDLITLAKKAKIVLTEPEKFYLNILKICSVWAGRYPLPIKEDQMPIQRKSMQSRVDLFDRNKKMHKDLIDGKIKRLECEYDILHGSIGTQEINCYKRLRDKLIEFF